MDEKFEQQAMSILEGMIENDLDAYAEANKNNDLPAIAAYLVDIARMRDYEAELDEKIAEQLAMRKMGNQKENQ
jgi:hypothetical protein